MLYCVYINCAMSVSDAVLASLSPEYPKYRVPFGAAPMAHRRRLLLLDRRKNNRWNSKSVRNRMPDR